MLQSCAVDRAGICLILMSEISGQPACAKKSIHKHSLHMYTYGLHMSVQSNWIGCTFLVTCHQQSWFLIAIQQPAQDPAQAADMHDLHNISNPSGACSCFISKHLKKQALVGDSRFDVFHIPDRSTSCAGLLLQHLRRDLCLLDPRHHPALAHLPAPEGESRLEAHPRD